MTFALGYKLNAAGIVTVGTVYLFVHYLELLQEPIYALARQIESFRTIGACVERLTEFRAAVPGIRGGNQPIASHLDAPHPHALELTLENVNFSYNSKDAILRDISFALPHGRVLGLLGRTGSGKTTLGRLVARLYDPVEGVIQFNGTDLRDARIPELRSRVTVVSQDV